MKRLPYLLAILVLLSGVRIFAQSGFNSVTNITPFPIVSNTGEIPQSKVWTYSGHYWTVMASSAGTIIYRLDGNNWTESFLLGSGSTAKADVKIVGNLAHIFIWKGTSSYLYSVQYNPQTNDYEWWSVRRQRTGASLESKVKTATIDIDGNGRMWLASDGIDQINIRYSDYPYTTWSSPVNIASGVAKTDLSCVIAMPAIHKVGVFWSNAVTHQFGFRTHDDGDNPSTWSSDELPGAGSALPIGDGFADNQFNVKSGGDGILYSVVKTNYHTSGYPQIQLLIRNINGTWSGPHNVTSNEGTFPTLILNEDYDKLKVIYSLANSVAYKESKISNISFGQSLSIIDGDYNNATSAKAPYSPGMVILASNATTIVGVLGIDDNGPQQDIDPPFVQNILRVSPEENPTNAVSLVFKAVFSEPVSGVDISDFIINASGSATGNLENLTALNAFEYEISVTGVSGEGGIKIDLKSSSTGIQDNAGNVVQTGYASGESFTIQQNVPTLTNVSIASSNTMPSLAKNGDVITLDFIASEPVNVSSVTVAGQSADVVAGPNNSFTATYTINGSESSGAISFAINFFSIAGSAGTEVTTTTNGTSVELDNIIPTVVSINREFPSTDITSVNSVIFRVTFSESVGGVDVSDFSLLKTGSVSGAIESVVVSASCGCVSTYDVSVSEIAGEGTVRLDLRNSGTSITDPSGNAINSGFSEGQIYTIQQEVPILSTVGILSNNPNQTLAKPGDIVTLNFTSSEAINLPSVTIANHPVSPNNIGGNNYNASYTILSSDQAGIVPFKINFSSTSGASGAEVTNTTNGSSVTFDNTLPTVNGITRFSPVSETTGAASVVFKIVFSEPVNGVDLPDFSLNLTGSVTGVISGIAATSQQSFDITISSITGDGSLRLDLKNGQTGISDLAGNNIVAGYNVGESYTIQQVVLQPGFASVIPLTPIDIVQPTKDKPQAKVWKYAGQWWSVLSTSPGTTVYRLDGTTWTSVLKLTTKSSKPDCWVDGNLVHILIFKGGSSNSYLSTIEYNPQTNTYVPWHVRPANVTFGFPTGSETATLLVDNTGRMWMTAAGVSNVNVWWSDAPYNTWSSPIVLASGVTDDDLCTLASFPNQNQIGVFWSNQTTKRFGFRMHADGTSPSTWTADENPASQSAIENIGDGFCDDHMNVKVATDGTMYCAAKTSYDKTNYAKIILLVRRPGGVWDEAYTITEHPVGTQPIVILNESQNRLKVLYTTNENVGGDIAYRETSTDNISFGPPTTLISDAGIKYNYASSTHQNYSPEVVILATDNTTSSRKAVGVIASDVSSVNQYVSTSSAAGVERLEPIHLEEGIVLNSYPNPFSSLSTINFSIPRSGAYKINLYNSTGSQQKLIAQGWAKGGVQNTVTLQRGTLAQGIYLLMLQTETNSKVIKIMIGKD